jgi:hypothetical protein
VQSHAIGTTFSVWLETVRGVDMAAIVALPTLPWTTVAGLFVAVAVLWLAGNRWLLTPLTRTPRSLHRNDPL